jgi:hypothetical protein
MRACVWYCLDLPTVLDLAAKFNPIALLFVIVKIDDFSQEKYDACTPED